MIDKKIVDKHFGDWKSHKMNNKPSNLLHKEIVYFKDNSEETEVITGFYTGSARMLNDLFYCNYFSEAKDLIDFVISQNNYTEFKVNLKSMIYDHQDFFISNGKETLFNQIEKYVAHQINVDAIIQDRILTKEEASEMLGMNIKTFERHHMDKLKVVLLTPGRVGDGYNARKGFRLSEVQTYIKNL